MRIRSNEHLPSFDYFSSFLLYNAESGLLFWRYKGFEDQDYKRFNTRYAGRIAGTTTPLGYVVIIIEKTAYMASRLAWLLYYGTHPENEIDHIDGNKSNNRISNLRPANRYQNVQNIGKYPTNTSGHKGVNWVKAINQWEVRITVNGNRIHLGYFPLEQIVEAGECYRLAAMKYHGAFARV